MSIFRDILNTIEGYYLKSETRFEEISSYSVDDIIALLISLTKSLAYDDLVKKNIIDPNIWEKFGRID